MKRSTHYFKTMYRRRNVIKEALLAFFLGLSSWPRMLLEVPIRRNFGERYFKFSTAVIITVILALTPISWIEGTRRFYGGSNGSAFLGSYLTWYAYLAYFFYCALQRREEIKRLPGVFDFARFSLSTGLINRFFYEFEINGRRFSVRTIETVLEPSLFFIAGMVLWFSTQPIGFVLLICSIFYSFSYIAAYTEGDNFLMDKIDERICNEELVNAFINDTSPEESRGFNFYGRRPADPDARRQMANLFVADDEIVEAM
ncbi:hypothetical protein [Fibrella forsythiae]|uniref:ABC transporter ATP-binding protein n=1 Tax=Fibrella forsythiae TaxID=2817061 RepID=A0ABS3JKP4_9BACT|nr:hypothetical protein [Fibrella forsythiae]MBO0950587.1 hypothetical protein [Fibrella forsythiae]